MSEPLRLGLAGLGTVGSGVLHILERHGPDLAALTGRALQVTSVSARERGKNRDIDISSYRWFDNPVEMASSGDIDVFVELIGGEADPAKAAVTAALKARKHVVTANKALLAHSGIALARHAEKNGVSLNFEAAVAGGIPIVKTMRESLLGNSVSRVYGILNGTCNYILTRMEREGRAFADVLADAQKAGYAEADPTFDIGGHDTAHKLALLTTLAFGVETSFDSIYLEGIESISPADIEAADELGYRIKLLGVAMRTDSGIEQRVHPAMVPKHSALAEVDGVKNCVAVDGDFVGDVMLVGKGAGSGPTASSVISDIVDIVRGSILPPFIRPARNLKPYRKARMRAHEGGYYIRLAVTDKPGSFAAIAHRMAEQEISLKSIVQRPPAGREGMEDMVESALAMPVVMITHETTEQAI
ncbi:MAG: homoserine dehydrogenase, partial [Pseudomonadota bacterium]|nr:homoserine dehydrogenase [Pseudomonadota bacterium]